MGSGDSLAHLVIYAAVAGGTSAFVNSITNYILQQKLLRQMEGAYGSNVGR